MNHLQLAPSPTTAADAGIETIRVLHVINGEHYSGAERVQDLLARRLPECGYEVGFACLKPGRFAAQRRSRQSELFSLPMRHKLDLRAVRQGARLARQQDYRLIHAHTPRALMIGALIARRCRLPLIYHVHSPAGRDSTRWLQNRLNLAVESWFARDAAKVVCVSNSVRQYMQQQGYRGDQLQVVPNGVPCVQPLPEREAPTGTWTLGTTALFRPRKGTEVLLEALRSIRAAGCDARLLAVGPFESEGYRRELLCTAEQLGVQDHITWTGFQSDVNRCFQQMDLFVLPSLFGEGLPMVVLEAMANGVPVVAADVEGVRQAIRHETDGLVFPAADSEALAVAVRDVMSGSADWTALRESALKRQRSQFSDLAMATRLARVYDDVLVSRLGPATR